MNLEISRVLEGLLGAYPEEAPAEVQYPYIVFSMRRLSENEGKQYYSLEVNVWDNHCFYSRAENMMDGLERRLHRYSHMTDGFFLRFFKGSRQNVPDPDKAIKRVREQFEMHVFEREA